MWKLLILFSVFQTVFSGGDTFLGWKDSSYILISSEESGNVELENFVNEQQDVENQKRPKLGGKVHRIHPEPLSSEFSQPDPFASIILEDKENLENHEENPSVNASSPRFGPEFGYYKTFLEALKGRSFSTKNNAMTTKKVETRSDEDEDDFEEFIEDDEDDNDITTVRTTRKPSELPSEIKPLPKVKQNEDKKQRNKNWKSKNSQNRPKSPKRKLKQFKQVNNDIEQNNDELLTENSTVSPTRKILRRLVRKTTPAQKLET